MTFSLSKSIFPMSELRADLDKIKKRLKDSPIIITNKGKPDFGLCDLDTLELAMQIKKLKELLVERKTNQKKYFSADSVFGQLDKKYNL